MKWLKLDDGIQPCLPCMIYEVTATSKFESNYSTPLEITISQRLYRVRDVVKASQIKTPSA